MSLKQKKTIVPTAQAANSRQGRVAVGVQRTVVHTASTIFDPDVLDRYSRLVPDAPERVLRVFEQNAETERVIVLKSLEYARQDNRRRDWMGFAIIIFGMATSGVLAYLQKPWLSGAALVAIVAYAVIGYLNKKKSPPPLPAPSP